MDHDETRVAPMMIRFMNHYARTIAERQAIIKFFNDDTYLDPGYNDGSVAYKELGSKCAAFPDARGKMGTAGCMGMMYDYFTVGFANTLGYAHANSGDTMTSVMIGGLRTVMNGDFEIFAGDLVQFYWYHPLPLSLISAIARSGGDTYSSAAGASRRTTSSRTAAASSTSTYGTTMGRR
jgi:hypothetical protein